MPDAVTSQVADRPARGIAFMLAAILTFAVQDAVVKWLAADYPVMEIMFFRGVFGLIPCAVVVYRAGGLASLGTRRPGVHLLRSGLLLGALFFFYLAIRAIPLADAVAISFSAPLFMTALSVPFLGERVGARRWAAVLVGFAGVLVIARPGAGLFQTAALFAVLSSLLFAISMIVTRRLSRSDSSAAILLSFTLFNVVVSSGFLPFVWTTPLPGDALLMAGVGLMGGVGAFCMVEAVRLAPVAVIAPFEFSSLIWATLIGYLVWGDVPGPVVLAGAAIIIASNVYILRREAGGGETPLPPPPARGRRAPPARS